MKLFKALLCLLIASAQVSCWEKDEDRAFACTHDFHCGEGWSCGLGYCVEGMIPVRLGMTAALSGHGAFGAEVQMGIEAALEKHNKEGGVFGRSVLLSAANDDYDPTLALENVIKLLDVQGEPDTDVDLDINPNPTPDPMGQNRVFAFMAPMGTKTASAVYNYLSKQKTFLFAPVDGSTGLRQDPPQEWLFNFRAGYQQEVDRLVEYFLEEVEVPFDNIWLMHQDDEFGADVVSCAIRSLSRYNSHVKERADLPKVSSFDAESEESMRAIADEYTQALQALADATPDGQEVKVALIMGDMVSASLYLLPTIKGWYDHEDQRAVRDKVELILSRLSIGNATIAQTLGMREQSEAYDGLISTQVVPPYNLDATFLRKYREALYEYCKTRECTGHGSFASLEGYIIGEITIHSMRRHWELEKPLNTEAFKETFETFHGDNALDLGLCSEPACLITYSSTDHQGIDKVWLTRLERKLDEDSQVYVPVFTEIK